MLLASEIVDERSVEHLDLTVSAPEGDVRVTHVCRTVPMRVWRLVTETLELECAGSHIVITPVHGPRQVDLLRPGDSVYTSTGMEAVVSCTDTGEVRELFDLRVESDSHTYFTNGILSHNSTGLGAAELFQLYVMRNYRSVYIAPLKEHIKTFADKLMDMQRASIYPPEYVTSKGLRNNMYYKESPNGGFLRLMHILTDPTKIRGISAGAIRVDEAQDFDSEHLPEIDQVQKAFRDTKTTVFAGTSKDLDTCLEHQFQIGSRGIWHLRCGCKDKWHALNDSELLPRMMSVDGLRCPHTNILLNPIDGEFIHEDSRMLEMNQASFHLPQLIVPEYASGPAFADIWRDYKRYPYKKFLQEVMGIAVDAGLSELTETDLKKCCSDKTFDQLQQAYLKGKTRYVYVVSGVDWGGSDWNPATRTKQSYTVHTIYGLTKDGVMELIYARRYAGMHYQDIIGTIIEAHNKFKCFAIGTDNGGGAYYNAMLRDCGRIRSDRIINFQYTDTHMMLERIEHPHANLMSLHRTDSISALIVDIKSQKIRFPRWDDCEGFVTDFLNMRRNITETQTGRAIMRYIKHGAKADDFMQSTNYATMMKRILVRESTIPNQQILKELGALFGTGPAQPTLLSQISNMGGYVSG